MQRFQLALLFPGMLLCSMLFGCPTPIPADAGTTAPLADGGETNPNDPNVRVDLGCSSDNQCGAGQICDLDNGICVTGYDCSNNAGLCEFCGEAGFECGFSSTAFCDENAGVCRRSKNTCNSCNTDSECGANANFENKCIGGFCAAGCGACPAGFACQQGGCVPVEQAGSCETALRCDNGETCPDGQRCSDLGVCLNICSNDEECALGEICAQEQGPLFGICVQGCPAKETLQSNGQNLICHADGRFGPLCSDDSNCENGLVCELADGFCSSPGCQSSRDCPLARTYCDANGACVEGCETENDCGAFELCEANECKKQGCRGKDVSCTLGEWCCGKDAYTDASTCPTPVEEGSCFLAPDPWCRTCEEDVDCENITAFGYASYCYELQEEDENGETVTLGKFCSVGCDSNADCPRGIQCIDELPTAQEGVTTKGCLSARCVPLSEAQAQAQP